MKRKSYESLIKSLNEGLKKAEERVAGLADQYSISTDKTAWAREAQHAREMVETWKDWLEHAPKPQVTIAEPEPELEEATAPIEFDYDTSPFGVGMEM